MIMIDYIAHLIVNECLYSNQTNYKANYLIREFSMRNCEKTKVIIERAIFSHLLFYMGFKIIFN